MSLFYLKPDQLGLVVATLLASFPGSRAGEEEREPGTHCSHMRQVPLVTCILLRYTKITVNSVYLLKGRVMSKFAIKGLVVPLISF